MARFPELFCLLYKVENTEVHTIELEFYYASIKHEKIRHWNSFRDSHQKPRASKGSEIGKGVVSEAIT
jgi:hypothetical protein